MFGNTKRKMQGHSKNNKTNFFVITRTITGPDIAVEIFIKIFVKLATGTSRKLRSTFAGLTDGSASSVSI